MADKPKAAILASLVGDALALGVHWDYDPRHIIKMHDRVNLFLDPEPGSFHNGKKAGDFTHYGDQTLVLIDSLVQAPGFDLDNFSRLWQDFFRDYHGYYDKATKKTLANLGQGMGPKVCGSSSSDLAGAVRIAPLAALLNDRPQKLLEAVRTQTAFTHNNPAVLGAAEFLARCVLLCLDGKAPAAAMQEAAEQDYGRVPVKEWVEQGLDTREMKTTTAITRLGSNCAVDNALSGVVHLVAKYPDDLSTCLVECVMAGGDSAARAMAAGMVLGAALGMESIPDIWLNSLSRHSQLMDKLQKLGL